MVKILKKCTNKDCTYKEKLQFLDNFEFRKDTQKYRGQCKDCRKNYDKKRNQTKNRKKYQKNRKEYFKKWRKENKDKIAIYHKENYQNKKEIILIGNKEWRKKNPNYFKEYNKKFRNKTSSLTDGELIINHYLKDNNIDFESEKTFENCRNQDNNLLFFDFYLPNHNIIIEYDGIHHFEPIFGQERFESTKLFDSIKDEFCKTNNILLIRIPYWYLDQISSLLVSLLAA